MEEKEVIKQIAESLLDQLLISGSVEVNFDSASDLFNVKIETEDSGFLIGYHGETLSAFQLVLSLIVYRKFNRWVRLSLNVGDYREKREEQLKRLALSIAQKVKFSKEAQVVPNLTSAERRIVHLALAEDIEVLTESEGEGDERKLVIRPKL